jgi:hypothetical protein
VDACLPAQLHSWKRPWCSAERRYQKGRSAKSDTIQPDIHGAQSQGDRIGAWRRGGAPPAAAAADAPLSDAKHTRLLREVDRFMLSLPLGSAPSDVEVEKVVASRLYRAELKSAESSSKLSEW